MSKELAISKSRISLGIVAGAIIATMVALPTQVGAAKPEFAAAAKPGSQTIVQIVQVNDGEFDVLEAAVLRAGLVDALNGKKQYTVFAPTDAAFNNLLPGVTEADTIAVINGLDKATLQDILLYHVYSGRHTSASVTAAPSYQMLNGDKLSRTSLLSAGLASTNLSASNGVIHVINNVLTPPAN